MRAPPTHFFSLFPSFPFLDGQRRSDLIHPPPSHLLPLSFFSPLQLEFVEDPIAPLGPSRNGGKRDGGKGRKEEK